MRIGYAVASLLTLVVPVLAMPAARAAEPYEIHVIQALTGPGAFLGIGERRAIQLAEKMINDTGGIQGQPLRFVFHDDQSTPQVAVQLASEIVAQKPAIVFGSSLVATCRAMAPLIQDGPVMYCFSPGIHPDAGSYVFTTDVSSVGLATALVRYFRLKGWTRLALMFSTDASGQDAEQAIKAILAAPENRDMKIVETAHFNITDVSVAAQIATIKSADPQAMIAWSTGAAIGTIFRGLQQAGLDIPVGTTDGNMTYAQMTQYAAFLPRQLYMPASQWIVRDDKRIALDPTVAAQQKAFYAAFAAAGIEPDNSAVLCWDPVILTIEALRKLGPKATARQLRDYLAGLSGAAGVDGMYDFKKEPQRGLDLSDAVATRWDETAKTWKLVSKPSGIPLE